MDDEKIVYRELSFRIIGCAMEVHKALGPGFPEVVYERALAIELKKRGLEFERQKRFRVAYEGESVGDFRADFVVDGKVILELKAVPEMPSVFERQLHSYLRASKLRLGILINFGKEKLESKRIVY
ncbi:MAG TPA: GxxExxY protein [Verrucomicrobiae bacterium]|nr:GxxExxY protein [Verrucomicrobiae bacterium]